MARDRFGARGGLISLDHSIARHFKLIGYQPLIGAPFSIRKKGAPGSNKSQGYY